MRFWFTILLFLSLTAKAQILPGAIGFNAKPFGIALETTFRYSFLAWDVPATYSAGGVLINEKKYSNLNVLDQFGSAIVVTGGQGKFEIKNSAFFNTVGESVQFEDFGDGTGDTIYIHDTFFAWGKCGISLVNCNAVIKIDNNECIDPHGAKGGKGQFVQLNGCTAQPGSTIQDNEIEIFPGEGFPEDLISMFATSGTAGNPLLVRRNRTRGGGPSDSGGGFIAGDGDGSYITIEDNVHKSPGNYIDAAAGGDHIVIQNNYGWQADYAWTNIATYAYITNASTHCNTITNTGNHYSIDGANSNNLYWWGDPAETCGDVIGVDETEGDPVDAWLFSNFNDQTESSIDTRLGSMITYLSTDILWQVRDSGNLVFRYPTADGGWPASNPRPTANAGSDQSISITTATLSGSGGDTYEWVQVSGPNIATQSAPTSATNNLSGLVNGTYVFRLVAGDTNAFGSTTSYDADWITITKS